MTDKKMTYEQWRAAFKHNIKKKAIKTVSTCFQVAVCTLLAVLPLGMLIHWVYVGY